MPLIPSLARPAIGLALALGFVTAPVLGTGSGLFTGLMHHSHAGEFINAQAIEPFRVFVAIDAGPGRRSSRGIDNKAEAILFDSLAQSLPGGVRLVNRATRADLVLRVQERFFDVDFRIIDRDRKKQRYKRRGRFPFEQAGGCGIPSRAFYTRVTERGTARYAFDVRVRVPGVGRDRLALQGRTADRFSYGTDLVAATACGLQPTAVFPSRRIERLFANNSPQARRSVAFSVKAQAYAEAGARLAAYIRGSAQDFFDAQAAPFGGQVFHNGFQQPSGPQGFSGSPFNGTGHRAASRDADDFEELKDWDDRDDWDDWDDD